VGCAAVIMVGVFVLIVGGLFIINKAKDMAAEIDDNPMVAAAKIIAATNPDIELVEVDDENRVVTFRNTNTDEVYSLDFEDIEEGRINFYSDDESYSLELETGEGDEGRLTITTDEGTASFGAGAEAGELPSWVPVYPGTTPEEAFSAETGEGRSGAFTVTTDDGVEDVLDYYVSELENRGFEIVTRAVSTEGAFLTAESPDEVLSINLAASIEGGRTQVIVNFNEK
jgi:hypothetical protein